MTGGPPLEYTGCGVTTTGSGDFGDRPVRYARRRWRSRRARGGNRAVGGWAVFGNRKWGPWHGGGATDVNNPRPVH